MTTYQEFFLKNKKLFSDHNVEFQKIFKVALNSYWDIFTGFDVIAFDGSFIKPPDGVSTRQAFEKKYGKRAVELVEILIGYHENTII